ncbi:hypothetical protein HK100_006296, partial [Physocladia obscura]
MELQLATSKCGMLNGDSLFQRILELNFSASALRARKQSYLFQLEEKVAKLTSENVALRLRIQLMTQSQTTSNTESLAEQAFCPSLECANQIQLFQQRILHLEERFHRNSPEIAMDDFGDNNLTAKFSAEQLYGRIDVQSFKAKAFLIPPLKNAKNVDRIFGLFVKVSKARNIEIARSLLLKIMREHGRIQQKCGIIDRMNFIDVLAEFNTKHHAHVIHWCKMCIEHSFVPKQTPIIEKDLPPSILKFRTSVRKISGFSQSLTIIDELCHFLNAGDEYTIEDIFQVNYLLHSTLNQCKNIEERTRFWLA